MDGRLTHDPDEEWYALVVRSGIDKKVWAPVLPNTDVDQVTNAATSVRRVRAYAERLARTFAAPDVLDLVWVRDDEDTWGLYEREHAPEPRARARAR